MYVCTYGGNCLELCLHYKLSGQKLLYHRKQGNINMTSDPMTKSEWEETTKIVSFCFSTKFADISQIRTLGLKERERSRQRNPEL